jgi:hypothetical protein
LLKIKIEEILGAHLVGPPDPDHLSPAGCCRLDQYVRTAMGAALLAYTACGLLPPLI